jgi:archaeal flagellin FlaB
MPEILKTLRNEQKGITGLETAIILIAFVIVASVLAYVVISSGLFSSQKAKAAVNAGLEQTGATLELKGNVIASMTAGVVDKLYITVGLVPGGSPVDMTDTANGKNVVTISYSDVYQVFPSVDWTIAMLNSNNGDAMLDPGELAQVTIDLAAVNAAAASEDEKIGPYTTFSIQVTPPDGSVLPIDRTIPARVSDLINLR